MYLHIYYIKYNITIKRKARRSTVASAADAAARALVLEPSRNKPVAFTQT